MTTFEDVFKRVIFKFKDSSFANYIDLLKYEILSSHLFSAITDCQHRFKQDRLKFVENELGEHEFLVDLDNEEIELLATGTVYYWCDSQYKQDKFTRIAIGNSDYKTLMGHTSLGQIKDWRTTIKSDFYGKLNNYSFRYGGFSSLTTGGS